ncbi:MAG: isocitrate lyase/PEP mutase family protein [Actinomycetia bacterium]|nr:isocitrate lyase/PEP mutase family protein [Actinomycetes bacterium]
MSGILAQPSGPNALRSLLGGDEIVVAPGAYDALSARLIEEAGFPAVYMTGYGTAASLLGRPDVGLVTASEMIDNARRITGCVGVPVIADADTGYGNAINVIRTVRDYERAGVAGVHIEDQVMPKRCGHLTGKVLVPVGEMSAKIRAAVAARTDPDFVVIARTDARAVEGMDAALARAGAYLDAGADVLFVEAPESEAEIEKIAAAFAGVPLLFNWAEGGRTPPVSMAQLSELGYRIVIFPVGALLSAATAMRSHLAALRRDGIPAPASAHWPTVPEFAESLGLAEVRALESRFAE